MPRLSRFGPFSLRHLRGVIRWFMGVLPSQRFSKRNLGICRYDFQTEAEALRAFNLVKEVVI